MTAVHCVFYSKIQSNHTLCFINNRKMTIKNSAVPLYKSHNMTTSEAVCTLTVPASVGYCKIKNGGAVREIQLKTCCYQCIHNTHDMLFFRLTAQSIKMQNNKRKYFNVIHH